MNFSIIETNGNVLGTILKEIIRRMIIIIREERFKFKVEIKIGYSGKLDDIRTTGDIRSDEAARRKIAKCLSEFGIISEETGTIIGKFKIGDLTITIDSLDGTNAYKRLQSDGFGPMISIIHQGKVIAAYVGDAMTFEIYGYHPDSGSVHRIVDFNYGISLRNSFQKSLADSWIQLRDNPFDLSEFVRTMVGDKKSSRLFGGMNIGGGSIGLTMAKLWKGEVSAAVLKTSYWTPWDMAPVIGICRKLNYHFVEINDKDKSLKVIDIPVPLEVIHDKKEIIVVHTTNIPELFAWRDSVFEKK